MKLLIVTSRNFWPITGGHEYMLHNYAMKLNTIYGVEIFVVSLDDNKSENWPKYISEVHFLKKKSNLGFLLSSFKYFFSKKESLQSILYFKKKSGKELSEIISKIKPDSVLIDLVRMNQYAQFVPSSINLNLYAEDMFSSRYQMMYEKKQFKHALGQLSNNKFLNILSKIPFLMKTILKKETIRIKNEELFASKVFRKVIFVSSEEAETFNKTFNSIKGTEVTMGYDVSSENYLNHQHNGNKLSIIGNFTNAANKDSLLFIINKILPLVKTAFSFDIVGKIEPEFVENFKSNKLNFLGFAQNPDEVLSMSDIFLSPIVYGTGIKTKILQALSLGLPTITNDVGIMNISPSILDCIVLKNDPKEIAESVDWLLLDSDKRRKMSMKSVEFIKKNHDWSLIIEKLFSIIRGDKQ